MHRIGYEQPNLSDCPEPLRAMVEGCLAKDPADRPRVTEDIEQARALYPNDRLGWLPPALAAALAGDDTTTQLVFLTLVSMNDGAFDLTWSVTGWALAGTNDN